MLDFLLKSKYNKRLFIGIPVYHAVQPILKNLRCTIQHNPKQIRWVPLNNIHITLYFLGDISSDQIPKLIQSIEKNLTLHNFNISFENTGIFYSKGLSKVLWIGLEFGKKNLTKLNKQLEKAILSSVGNIKTVNFIPHVTVGRIKEKSAKIDVLPFLKYVYSPIEFSVNSVILYHSQLSVNGAEYKQIEKISLN